MKKHLYWLAVIFSVLLTIGVVINCAGTLHIDTIDWTGEKAEVD